MKRFSTINKILDARYCNLDNISFLSILSQQWGGSLSFSMSHQRAYSSLTCKQTHPKVNVGVTPEILCSNFLLIYLIVDLYVKYWMRTKILNMTLL